MQPITDQPERLMRTLPQSAAPYLQVQQLKTALADFHFGPLDLELHAGLFYGVLGGNGAGKSTLLSLLAGLLPHWQGDISYQQQSWREHSATERACQLSYLAQAPANVPLTVSEFLSLAFLPEQRWWQQHTQAQQRRYDEMVQQFDLATLCQRRLNTLSGGEQQRVQLARVMLQQADLLILDEPLNHLDLKVQQQMLHIFATSPRTVVASLHDINLAAQYCDQLLVLKQGKLIGFGTPNDIITPSMMKQAFDLSVDVAYSPVTNLPMVILNRQGPATERAS